MMLRVAASWPVAADSEDETSRPTKDKHEEMLLTLANGIRPSVILPSVAGDSAAADADVGHQPGISSTETRLNNGVRKLR